MLFRSLIAGTVPHEVTMSAEFLFLVSLAQEKRQIGPLVGIVSNQLIFAADAVMASRAYTTPTIHHSCNAVTSWVNVYPFAYPMMMYIKHDRNNIADGQTMIQSMGYLVILYGYEVAGFYTEP